MSNYFKKVMTRLASFIKATKPKVDDVREYAEDYVADNLLTKLEGNETVDNLIKQGIRVGIECGNAYLTEKKLPTVPEGMSDKISDVVIKELALANKAIEQQLKKKGKGFKERHGE
jgi:hypothetical protein